MLIAAITRIHPLACLPACDPSFLAAAAATAPIHAYLHPPTPFSPPTPTHPPPQDTTGVRVQGCVHTELVEEYGPELAVGAVLLLAKAGRLHH